MEVFIMDIIEVDVRGLSCPEPVMITMDAMDDYPDKIIKIIGDEAHTKTNIIKTLQHQHRTYELVDSLHEFTITVTP